MTKYIFILLCIILTYSCKTTKEKMVATPEEAIEVVEEEKEEVIKVPDHPNLENKPFGHCSDDWSKRERLVLYKDQARISKMVEANNGQIFVITQVNRDGLVVDARIDERNTTVEKKIWLNVALEIVLGYQFEPDPNAAVVQCGTIKFLLTTM